MHLNGGFQGSRGLEFTEPYVQAIKEQVGLLVGVQLAPERDFSHYDRLIELGVDHLSFCVELLDPEWFARICPGKARMLGQELFFDAMDYCARRMPHGRGLRRDHRGHRADRDARSRRSTASPALGAFPTVCIFRPTVGSDMEDWPPPDYDDMRRVMAHVYDACRRNWLPIGAAPNIEVSLVVNPDDAALLADRGFGDSPYEAWRRLVRVAAQPMFRHRMRTRRPR